jgi:hypothetical protein
MPGNAEAVKIWDRSRTQVIAGVGGVIDINVLAVKMLMDLYGVRDQRTCLEKVRILFSEYLATLKEREDAKSEN